MRKATILVAIAVAYAGIHPSAGADAAPVAGVSIARGQLAGPDYGFSAAVYQDGRLDCTGSVISSTAVLTAAHCVTSPTRMTVRTGSLLAWGGGEYLGVTGVAVSPNPRLSDVAILRLASPTSAPPIKTATPEEDAAHTYPGAIMGIAGFGNRQPNTWRKSRYGLLTAANVRLSLKCRYLTYGFVPAADICALGTRHFPLGVVANTCDGDSGGPMVLRLPDGLRLFGVANSVLFRRHLGYRCGGR